MFEASMRKKEREKKKKKKDKIQEQEIRNKKGGASEGQRGSDKLGDVMKFRCMQRIS